MAKGEPDTGVSVPSLLIVNELRLLPAEFATTTILLLGSTAIAAEEEPAVNVFPPLSNVSAPPATLYAATPFVGSSA